ncbi:MAG: Crp/Fnr family transcriptional regulator [Spirochaetes bacterium]|nr:Crp/Fnr family transcriptional regulator [Spirochaetota bacterium]
MLNISHSLAASVVNFIELSTFGSYRQYEKGRILLWQGDKVRDIFVIKDGIVKIYAIAGDGRTYTYGVLGKGGLVGVPQFLLDEESRVMIEAMEMTSVIVLPSNDFQYLLANNPHFSMIMMKKLAKDLRNITDKAEGFGLLNVQDRLKRIFSKLAEEHGIKTDKGIRIKVDITHKDIGELIGANRTTITYFINELKRQGYLQKDGKYFILTQNENYETTV